MYIFHDHLDGGLRPHSLLEMAIDAKYEHIMNLNEQEVGLLLDKSDSISLEDFLSAFVHTIAMMQSYENEANMRWATSQIWINSEQKATMW